MIVCAIVAMDRNGLIGAGGKLPWHLPGDLKRFRALTMGCPVIMGRKTFCSLGKPLDGRENIVLSRSGPKIGKGFRVSPSIEDAIGYHEYWGTPRVWIIGGAEVYAATCHLWDELAITSVAGDYAGDAHFPLDAVDAIGWKLVKHAGFVVGGLPFHTASKFRRIEPGEAPVSINPAIPLGS